jgi:lipoic acid synthetase
MRQQVESNGGQHLEVLDWGLLPYGEALARQETLVAARIADSSVADHLIVVEHPPVVTIGQRGSSGELRVSKEALQERGVEVYSVGRGGMATLHGPGQLVAYPILVLRERDIHLYVRTLEETVAEVLREYSLKPEFKPEAPGVWVGSGKIASIGIAVRRWVTYHGVALNVNNDLDAFNWIVPCGHPGEIMTSMKEELGRPLPLGEVKERFIRHFRTKFGYVRESGDGHRLTGLPSWLTRPVPKSSTDQLLQSLQLNTVCQSADCPNLGECFNRGVATFMILGNRCTRSCRFCAVDKGSPQPVDPKEPDRVACAVELLGLKHAVITSVTRDDLADGGAGQYAQTIARIRSRCPGASVEILVPDCRGEPGALQTLCDARPDVFNHNIETVPRLYSRVRPGASYRRSLGVLSFAATQGLPAKSGLMLGLGETRNEVLETLEDLIESGCRYLTLGQYLAPSEQHVPVARYVSPMEFDEWAETARLMGFSQVAAGPLVRSSYRADAMFHADGGRGMAQGSGWKAVVQSSG